MKKCPSCQADVEDSLLRCSLVRRPLQREKEDALIAADGVSLFRSVTPSGIGREKVPREKKLLVGSLLAGSLGIVLAIVGLPAALFSGWVGAILSVYGLLAAFQRAKKDFKKVENIVSFLVPAIGLIVSGLVLLLGFLL